MGNSLSSTVLFPGSTAPIIVLLIVSFILSSRLVQQRVPLEPGSLSNRQQSVVFVKERCFGSGQTNLHAFTQL
jgi:hypothetical protein